MRKCSATAASEIISDQFDSPDCSYGSLDSPIVGARVRARGRSGCLEGRVNYSRPYFRPSESRAGRRVPPFRRASRRQDLQYGNRPSDSRSADRVKSPVDFISPHREQYFLELCKHSMHSLFHDVGKQMPSRTFPHCRHRRGSNLRLLLMSARSL